MLRTSWHSIQECFVQVQWARGTIVLTAVAWICPPVLQLSGGVDKFAASECMVARCLSLTTRCRFPDPFRADAADQAKREKIEAEVSSAATAA